MPSFKKVISIVLGFLLLSFSLSAQLKNESGKKLILVKQATLGISEIKEGVETTRFIGDCIFEHEGALMYCDSATLFNSANQVKALGNVYMNIGDTLFIYSDSLFYDGNLKTATLYDNVKLIDKTAELSTDLLIYDRLIERAHYPNYGVIVSDSNRLTSINGYYYTSPKEFLFQNNVVLTNPDYVLKSDTLLYKSEVKTAVIRGPTTITGKDRYIYAESGWYDTRYENAHLRKKVFIRDKDRTLNADTVYYQKKINYGEAFGHVILHDTTQNIFALGKKAKLFGLKELAWITGNTEARMVDKEDTLFLHADSLKLIYDTVQQDGRFLYGFHHVKFFKKDMQGVCDSIVYAKADSMATMFGRPILWNENNQLTADTIYLWTSNQTADSSLFKGNAFIVQEDDSLKLSYNQVKGRDMRAYFKDDSLRTVFVNGNAETVYYSREEDRTLVGILYLMSSKIKLNFESNDIREVIYIEKPDGGMYPEKDYPTDKLRLKGFIWNEKDRPRNKKEIFIHRE